MGQIDKEKEGKREGEEVRVGRAACITSRCPLTLPGG